MAVDSAYVLRPAAVDDQHARPGTVHLDLVRRMSQAMAAQSLDMYKVKSHLTSGVAREQGFKPWAWHGNFIADQIAEKAARRCQLPPSVVQEVLRLDTVTGKVLRRLEAVLKEAVEEQRPRLQRARAAGEQEQPEVPEEAAAAGAAGGNAAAPAPNAAAARSHTWQRLGPQVSFCQACQTAVAASMQTPGVCEPPQQSGAGERVHSSHRVVLFRGLLFCLHCGAWAFRRTRKLACECKGPCKKGEANLRAIGQDKKPQGLPRWPEQEV